MFYAVKLCLCLPLSFHSFQCKRRVGIERQAAALPLDENSIVMSFVDLQRGDLSSGHLQGLGLSFSLSSLFDSGNWRCDEGKKKSEGLVGWVLASLGTWGLKGGKQNRQQDWQVQYC
jgi:hypothetical protein